LRRRGAASGELWRKRILLGGIPHLIYAKYRQQQGAIDDLKVFVLPLLKRAK
jgi:hypothetical protein